jgi:hypothetical protein
MTMLTALKTTLLDKGNNICTDEEYSDFLELKGFNAADDYTNEDELMLLKADFLESVLENPTKWNSYKEGQLQEDISPETIRLLVDSLRLRHTVVSS